MFSLLALATHIAVTINAAQQDNQITAEAVGHRPQTPKVRFISVPGDLVIGGVFPVHRSAPPNSPVACGEIAETRGVHRVEAMLYALDMINEQKELLRGLKLGALILDSCSSPTYALNQSLDFVRDMIGTEAYGGSDANDYQCSDGTTPIERGTKKKNVVAVVGGSYSSVTVQVANLLRLFHIVQVSPASTNADLSDKSRFEFFARTVPSDNYQVRAMISIAKEFNWTYVSLLYSADEYGELGAEAFKKEARKENICIATEERILPRRDSMREPIDNFVKKMQPEKPGLGAQVVVLIVNTDFIRPLMEETVARMQLHGKTNPKKIIWMASEGWDRNNNHYVEGDRWRAAEGAIVLMLDSQRIPSFERYYRDLRPGSEKFDRNEWLRELWAGKYKCHFDLPMDSQLKRCEDIEEYDEDFHADDKVQFTINAVYAIAHALDSMYKQMCHEAESVESSWISRHSRKPELCQAMRKIDGARFYKEFLLNVKFNDSAGKPFHFSPEGDGPASYTILNYQPKKDKNGQILRESNRSDYVVIGQWTEGQLTIDHDKLVWTEEDMPRSVCSVKCASNERKQMIKDEQCCWACVRCEDYEYLHNETTCIDCGLGRWPTLDRKSCYNIWERELKYMRWNSAYAVVPSIFAGIGIVATIFVIICYIKFNETPVVKASGRELSYILLIAMILCYMMTFVLLAKPSKITCGIKRTGIGLAFSTLYAAMFVKTNRIARIFSKATRSAARPSCISPLSQVGLAALLIGIQLVYSVIWLIIVPPGTRHDYPTRKEVVLTCNVPDHHFLYSLAYDAALIILCTIYAVKTRKVPENFNETKFIGFSMYTTCVLWVSWIFFFFGTSSNFQMQTSSLCISISMSANVALVCIFSPKIYIILFEKQKNVRKQDGEYMLSKSSRSTNNNRANSTYGTISDEPTQYTALLSEQRRRSSRRLSQPSTASSAQDTFL